MKHYGTRAGLLTGAITVGLFALFHQLNPRWILQPLFYWGSLVIYLLGMLGVCLLEKRNGQGILPFRQALQTAFLTFLIANLLYYLFYYFLFNTIDPHLAELQRQVYLEFYEQNFSGLELQKHLQGLEDKDFSVNAKVLLIGFGQGAIGGFLLSLLIALTVKQER